MNFLWSDAWLLLATIHAGQGKAASLEAVVGAAADSYVKRHIPKSRKK